MKLSKNFTLEEFACKDGSDTPPEAVENLKLLAAQLQVLRDYTGKSIGINSGYRSKAHNTKIGGAKNSMHLYGKAADITVSGMKASQVHALIEKLIADGKMKDGGIGKYHTWTHYDIGEPRRWNGA